MLLFHSDVQFTYNYTIIRINCSLYLKATIPLMQLKSLNKRDSKILGFTVKVIILFGVCIQVYYHISRLLFHIIFYISIISSFPYHLNMCIHICC